MSACRKLHASADLFHVWQRHPNCAVRDALEVESQSRLPWIGSAVCRFSRCFERYIVEKDRFGGRGRHRDVSREVGLGYRDGDANEVNYDIFEAQEG